MNLAPRLKKIIDFLNLPTKVADIGTDHAYIPIHLAQESNCSVIIASDCNEEPYRAAKTHIQDAGVEEIVNLRLGSGLSVLEKKEVDTIIIAGMGGAAIREIIAADYELSQELEQLVLQPMAGAASLRKWLVDNKFKLTDEALVNHATKESFYQILSVKPGLMKVEDEFLLEIGPKLIEDPSDLLDDYLNYLEKSWQRIKEEITANAPKHPKIKILEDRLKRLEEVKEWL